MVLSNTMELESENAYLDYFVKNFIKQSIYTHDGIRIHFRKGHFYHAFFESTISHKDCFSFNRARHMPEILTILQSPAATCHCGWNNKERRHDPHRRVAYLLGTFLVVIILNRNKSNGKLSGDFLTCFEADEFTFKRVKQDPLWDALML